MQPAFKQLNHGSVSCSFNIRCTKDSLHIYMSHTLGSALTDLV